MGTGGVGSWVVESLARAGVGLQLKCVRNLPNQTATSVGSLILIDPGLVKLSNCSQQIPALTRCDTFYFSFKCREHLICYA